MDCENVVRSETGAQGPESNKLAQIKSGASLRDRLGSSVG